MKSIAHIGQSEQTPEPAQPKWVEIHFICHWPSSLRKFYTNAMKRHNAHLKLPQCP